MPGQFYTYLLRLGALAVPVVAFLVLAAPAFAQGSSPTFQTPDNYGPAPNPVDIVNADFDLDGDLDLATANQAGGATGVSLFLNDGSGNYSSPPFNFNVGAGATNLSSIEFGFFNNDGKPDIVVTDLQTDSVIVILNTTATPGVPTFSGPTATSVGAGSDPTDVAVGDFNVPGPDDLAVTNPGTDTVSILISQGNGAFTVTQTIPPAAGLSDPVAADAADFNNDGDVDVMVANNGANNALTLLNDGTGSFTPGNTEPVGSFPVDVIAADFNEDGNQDFATANAGTGSVSVALNNGNATFQISDTVSVGLDSGTNPVTQRTSELAVDDYNLDCDDNLDIAVTSPGEDSVLVFLGDGDGTFDAPPAEFPVDGTEPSGLTSGDFDEQNGPDLATSNYGSNDISVLLNSTPTPSCGNNNNNNNNNDDNGTITIDDNIDDEEDVDDEEDDDGVSAAEDQYTDGTSDDTGGTLAEAGTDPDEQAPVDEPVGDVVDEVDTGGEPLPETGGLSLGGLAAVVAISVFVVLVGGAYLWQRVSGRGRGG